ncbi:MAG: phospholipid/glycerol acyltransferase [Sediminibacterium sp.]|nr:phospholipid/glycerol acyltransferase [Sediminibacterium sp.]
MAYSFIKMVIRLALKIFCWRVAIGNKSALLIRGPVLVTANHPNSFLDAIIIGSLFDRPVHFLARGDAFRKPWHGRLLRLLNMIPVYRLSEGKENLSLNDNAFRQSGEILAANGIVLIFIEGICIHKHELQPFKKGAARIALENKAIKGLQILPLGIAYNSFERFGKSVNINIGEPLLPQSLFPFEEEAKNARNFNAVLCKEIEELIDVPSNETPSFRTKNKWLFLPAITGYILHILFYQPVKEFLKKKTRGTVFFDSVLFGSLLFLYPIYVLFICLLLGMLHVHIAIIVLLFFLFPLTAWCAVQWRRGFRPQ